MSAKGDYPAARTRNQRASEEIEDTTLTTTGKSHLFESL